MADGQALLDGLRLSRYRLVSHGVAVGEYHPETAWVEVIDRATGRPVGLKVQAHDEASADAAARDAAVAMGVEPDGVTALWSPRP